MAHDLHFTADNYGDGTQILYTCTTCGGQIAFSRPGMGEPHASLVPGQGWQPPENPEQWLGPCGAP